MRGIFVRPLLDTPRQEIEDSLAGRGIPHVEDRTNTDPAHTRNRIRHEVLPLLRRENPNLSETVFRMDAVLRQEDSYLEKQASSLLQSCALSSGSWSCSVLRAAPQALQARAMRLLLAQLNIAKPAQAHVDALMHLIASSGGSSSVTLPDGKMLRRSYDILSIAADDLPQTFEPKALLLGGETEIPELSLRISCRFVKKYEKSGCHHQIGSVLPFHALQRNGQKDCRDTDYGYGHYRHILITPTMQTDF